MAYQRPAPLANAPPDRLVPVDAGFRAHTGPVAFRPDLTSDCGVRVALLRLSVLDRFGVGNCLVCYPPV
jgi:hypothetical protein